MKIYQRIRDLREDNDEKQTDISEMIGVSEATYRRYEQGKTNIILEDAEKLAIHYNVSIDYIAGLTNDKGGLHYLDREKRELISEWEQLSEIEKTTVKTVMNTFLKNKKPKNERKLG